MDVFVIAKKDKDTGNFIIETRENQTINQLVGRENAFNVFKDAMKEHGVANVDLFQLVSYEIPLTDVIGE